MDRGVDTIVRKYDEGTHGNFMRWRLSHERILYDSSVTKF